MKFIDNLRIMYRVLRSERKALKFSGNTDKNDDFCAAELIRYTHSLEKGMCIEQPRLGYGHKKQEAMMSLIKQISDSSNPYYIEAKSMAIGAIKEYLDYHKDREYSDDIILKLTEFVHEYDDSIEARNGGVLTINRDEIQFDTREIERFFNTRHSIRDFDGSSIDKEKLIKALTLAQKAPSACNRQGSRVYILGEERAKEYSKELAGIGGFETSVKSFIMITGKHSAYRSDEINQYIVSSSMYAAYLTLSLHLYGIGACIVQRPLIWDKNWDNLRERLGISSDEQLICLLAIGNLKTNTVVPESHRLGPDTVFNFIN